MPTRQKKCILLPLEAYSREFDSKLLLATKLSESGYRVIMADHVHIRYMTYLFSRGVYIGKNMHLYPPPYGRVVRNIFGKKILDTWYFDLLKRRNYSTIYLEEEGGYFSNKANGLYEDSIKAQFSTEKMNEDDYVATWGQEQATILKKNALFENNIQNTGHPRFDLYKKKYSNFYKNNSDILKNTHGSFVLINTNYSHANHHKGLGGIFTKSSIYDPDDRGVILNYSNKWDEQMKRYSSMVSLIFVLAVKFPEKVFIIRPHPAESENTYNYIFKDMANVVITKEDSVGSWLYACECLIHDGCTTGLEAALLEKKIINYNPVPLKYNNNELLSTFGPKATSSDEVVKMLVNIFNGQTNDQNYNNSLENISGILSNANLKSKNDSCESIVKILENIGQTKTKKGLLNYNIAIYISFLPYFASELFKNIASVLINRNLARYSYKKTTSYGIDKATFENKVSSMLFSTNSNVHANHISNHCFIFNPKK